MSIEVATVTDRRDLQRFMDFPHELYTGDPNYVPQLGLQQAALLGPDNPFRRHADMELFVARRRGQIVGRVAAIHNRLHDTHNGSAQGFFGFFDCENNEETARYLLTACRGWLAQRGLNSLMGPVNPDLNNSCGILTEGFELRPMIFMPYNAPYYGRLLEAAGLGVVKRLNAWEIAGDLIPREAFRYADRIEQRLQDRGYGLRPIDRSRFAEEVAHLRPVYNDALEGSWGHTPLTEAEFVDQATWLRRICPPDLIQVIEFRGKIVAFIGAAPDLNEALRTVKRGRLFPLGWLKLLRGRRRVRWTRIVMYGVDRQHRGTGLAIWLYLSIIRAVRANGYLGSEASYVLEDNEPVNDLSARIGGVCRKRYAIHGSDPRPGSDHVGGP